MFQHGDLHGGRIEVNDLRFCASVAHLFSKRCISSFLVLVIVNAQCDETTSVASETKHALSVFERNSWIGMHVVYNKRLPESIANT